VSFSEVNETAYKRCIDVPTQPVKAEGTVGSDEGSLTWRRWLVTVYAPFWFIAICLVGDLMGFLELVYDLNSPWEISSLFLVLTVPIEAYIYYFYWGPGKKKVL
jgi:hypothetical protein